MQRGGFAGVIQRRRAFLIRDELGGTLVRTAGVLHQTQTADLRCRNVPPQEQTAGRPVVQIEAAAGQGGLCGQAVGAPRAVEKCLVAGHGTGQSQLGKKIIVRGIEMEHQCQRAGSRDPQRTGSRCAVQHSSAVFNGRKLYRIGRTRLRLKNAPERKHKVLGGDGVVSGSTLDGGVGQAVLDLKRIGQAVGRDDPAFGKARHDLTIGVFAHKAAVEIFAGNDIRCCRSHLRVEIRRDGIDEPREAGRTGTGAAAGENKEKRNSKDCRGIT